MLSASQQIYQVNQVPVHFRELFIVNGYRSPKSSVKQCIRSIFEANNETFNIWTHFLPAVYFVWKTFDLWQNVDLADASVAWPMMTYMFGVCIFPISSAAAHIFNILSDQARHICFFFDYLALSFYALGTAIAYKAYIFPEQLIDSWFDSLYLSLAVFNAIVSFIISCETRFIQNGLLKKACRFTAFAVPYIFVSLPVIYRIVFCKPDDCESEALALHSRQFLIAFFSALMYISHIPERFSPGSFDIIGHSHQLFHILTVFGAHDQMSGLLLDMRSGRVNLLRHGDFPSFTSSLLMLVLVGFINLITLTYFIRKLYQIMPPAKCQSDKNQLNGVTTPTDGNQPTFESLPKSKKE